MTRLVIQKGCKRLGYIGALSRDKAVGQERKRAYQDAVREAGLEEQAEHTAVAALSMTPAARRPKSCLRLTVPWTR